MLNKVQLAARDLIESDARFFNTLMDISQNAKNINTNFILMSLPYMGIFMVDGVQWANKVGLKVPKLTEEEKEYYVNLRLNHKLFENTYGNINKSFEEEVIEANEYFYNNRGLFERIFGYNNVGVDYCNGVACGNTILLSKYMKFFTNITELEKAGQKVKEMSVVFGEVITFFICLGLEPFDYDDRNNVVKYKDYNFIKNGPLKLKNSLGIVLFSILCSINFVTVFIDSYFVGEIPQKFKFAYLQYYYLCNFIKILNEENDTNFYLNDSLKNRELRNCFSHYGLGQFMKDEDILEHDILKGLTQKAFNMDYYSSKELLYGHLDDLKKQIESTIF